MAKKRIKKRWQVMLAPNRYVCLAWTNEVGDHGAEDLEMPELDADEAAALKAFEKTFRIKDESVKKIAVMSKWVHEATLECRRRNKAEREGTAT